MSDATTTESQEPPPAPPPPRRFLRSHDDRILGGVCGGLAKYFNIDPTLVRIAVVVLTFVGGVGVIAYGAALAFVPEDDGTGNPAPRDGSRVATIAGGLLLAIAGLALIDGFHWWWGGAAPLAVILGVIGLIVYRNLRQREDGQPTANRVIAVTLLVIAATAAVFLLAVGGAWAAAAGGGAVVAAFVVALGVVMIAGAFRRPLRWLAIPALALAIPAGVVAAADINLDGGIGQRTYHPADVADIPAGGYKLGVGELRVDLRGLDFRRAGGRVPLKLDVGVGHALVLVPPDVCVRSTADVGAGYVGVLGTEDGGVDVKVSDGTSRAVSAPQLVLDTKLGMGAVEVLHDDHGWDGPGRHRGRDDSITPVLARMGCAGRV